MPVAACCSSPRRHALFRECLLLTASIQRCSAAVGRIDPSLLLELGVGGLRCCTSQYWAPTVDLDNHNAVALVAIRACVGEYEINVEEGPGITQEMFAADQA